MNHIAITGNLCADPELRTTQSGVSVASFRVAVSRRYRNAQGGHDADFFQVVAWRQTAEFVSNYLTKGRKVGVEGSMQCRQYDAQDGSKRTVWELIADNVEALDRAQDAPAAAAPTPPTTTADGFTEVDDDQLPFD